MINHKLKASIICQSVKTNSALDTKIDQTFQMCNILYFSERETPLGRCRASAINLCLQISGSDALCLSSVLVLLMPAYALLEGWHDQTVLLYPWNYCTVFAGRGKGIIIWRYDDWWYGLNFRFRLSRYTCQRMRFKKDSFPTLCTTWMQKSSKTPWWSHQISIVKVVMHECSFHGKKGLKYQNRSGKYPYFIRNLDPSMLKIRTAWLHF